jgi:hypothetical protein
MAKLSRSEIVLPIVTTLLGAVGGAAIVALPSYWGNNRQMDVKMVEIAIGILSQEPKENIAPARRWAVEVIDAYSDKVKLSKEVQDALVNYKVVDGWHDVASSYDWSSAGKLADPKIPQK